MDINYTTLEDVEARLNDLKSQRSQIEEESNLLEIFKQDLLEKDGRLNFLELVNLANSRIKETLESVSYNGLILPRFEIVEIDSNRNDENRKIVANLKTFDDRILTKFSGKASVFENWLEFFVSRIKIFQDLMMTYSEDLSEFPENDKIVFKIEDLDVKIKFDRDSNSLMTEHFSISADKVLFSDYENLDQSLINVSDHASISASYDYLDLKFEYFVRPTSLDSIESWINRILKDYDLAKEMLIVQIRQRRGSRAVSFDLSLNSVTIFEQISMTQTYCCDRERSKIFKKIELQCYNQFFKLRFLI